MGGFYFPQVHAEGGPESLANAPQLYAVDQNRTGLEQQGFHQRCGKSYQLSSLEMYMYILFIFILFYFFIALLINRQERPTCSSYS